MIHYELPALVSFALLAMGTIAIVLGSNILLDNPSSKSGKCMFYACLCVFFWDIGYGLMGMFYNSDWAYVSRAIALLSIVFYMYSAHAYLAMLSGYPIKKVRIIDIIIGSTYVISWLFIIGKSAVSFSTTPWGYWYKAAMTPARYVQFGSVLAGFIAFYVILFDWKKRSKFKRDMYVIKRFSLFGPVLFAGYTLDTLIPMIFHTAAIPGSAIGAFASSMILYTISVRYKTFGISVKNISEYVFKEVSVPVLALDHDDKIVLCNEMTTSFFDTDDLKGKHLYDLIEPVNGINLPNEERNSRLFSIIGEDNYCRIERSAVYDDFGEIQCYIIFILDVTAIITSMKIAEENRALAEESNKAKSNFLANMSHEIRTPMNAILGMSDLLLRDSKLDEESRSQLLNIKEAGDGLIGIINDILDFSKIESGKFELIPDDYDFADLIHEVSTIVNAKLQETPVNFKLTIDPKIPSSMFGDALKIRQILINLLGNAIKFTQKGTIHLRCRSFRASDDFIIYFDVIDSGIGIQEENLETIFGSFNQVDTRKNRFAQGTGLGLAISRNLAQLMGGDITVESVYGEGSTFHVLIHQRTRRYEQIGEETAKTLEEFKYKLIQKSSLEDIKIRPDKRVLIVDDSKVNLIVAKGLLKPYAMKVDTADSGMKAIEMVQENDYDLVFMDHMMPELDGVDTTKMIRKLDEDRYKNLPIVALTANAITGTKELLISEGMQDFLSKPIDKKELDTIIERWL